jgi:hypothetical protein
MRKIVSICLVLSLLAITMCSAFAAGKPAFFTDGKQTAIQNLNGVSPDPAAATCTTATVTKGAIATVTTTGYRGIHWEAQDASNAALRIKRHLNSNTAYIPGTGQQETLNGNVSTVAFKPYSAAARAVTVCYDLQ